MRKSRWPSPAVNKAGRPQVVVPAALSRRHSLALKDCHGLGCYIHLASSQHDAQHVLPNHGHVMSLGRSISREDRDWKQSVSAPADGTFDHELRKHPDVQSKEMHAVGGAWKATEAAAPPAGQ